MSSSVLYDRLRELNSSGLVERTSDDEYVLSRMGTSLGVALEALDAWAGSWAMSLRDSLSDA